MLDQGLAFLFLPLTRSVHASALLCTSLHSFTFIYLLSLAGYCLRSLQLTNYWEPTCGSFLGYSTWTYCLICSRETFITQFKEQEIDIQFGNASWCVVCLSALLIFIYLLKVLFGELLQLPVTSRNNKLSLWANTRDISMCGWITNGWYSNSLSTHGYYPRLSNSLLVLFTRDNVCWFFVNTGIVFIFVGQGQESFILAYYFIGYRT